MKSRWRVRLLGSAWLPGFIDAAEARDLRAHGFIVERVR